MIDLDVIMQMRYILKKSIFYVSRLLYGFNFIHVRKGKLDSN